MGFGPYIFEAPPTAHVKPTISGNGPVLDEKYLFVRVVGLSGAAGGDSSLSALSTWHTNRREVQNEEVRHKTNLVVRRPSGSLSQWHTEFNCDIPKSNISIDNLRMHTIS
jgi:hypothetical protein